MKVLDLMNKEENWEEVLQQSPYFINIKKEDDYVLLKYNQLFSDFSNEIVRECRGAIFRKQGGRWICVSRAFNKFCNYGESYAPKINWENAAVVEKIDGCFSGEDRVMLADGTSKKIKTIVNNKENISVLSYNFNTKTIESKKVIGWSRSVAKRPLSDWLTIHLKHIKTKLYGKISQHCIITPTKNHQFFVKRNDTIQEILAENLKVGDILLTPIVGLTTIEEQVILGTLLGDGSCTYYQEQDKSKDKGIRFCHSKKQEKYVKFKASLLQRLGGQVKNIVSLNSYGTEKTIYQSFVNSGISLCYNIAYKNYHKEISYEWLQRLGWLGFAIWYMDDGSLHTGCKNNSIHLHTEGFTKDEVELICKFYSDKGYKSYVQHYKKYYIINFSTEASELIWREIRKFIPECMQYKLPERHRGFFEKIVDTETPKIILSEGYIEKINDGLISHNYGDEDYAYSYDIEVEDNHNYFCQGVLVHNSLIKCFYDNDEWHIATNGQINAFEMPINDEGLTFGDLVLKALGGQEQFSKLTYLLDCNFTYMFELVSPITQVVIHYPNTELYYLGARDMITMREDRLKDNSIMAKFGIKQPKYYATIHDIDECIRSANEMGKDNEGFVVVDNCYNRIKVKSPEYLRAARLNNNNRITIKRVVEMMREEQLDDFIAYCPQHKEMVNKVIGALKEMEEECVKEWDEVREFARKEKKEFVSIVKSKGVKWPNYLYWKYSNSEGAPSQFFNKMLVKTITDLIKKKLDEKSN